MDEPEQLLSVGAQLKKLIVGQDQSIDEVVNLIRQAKLGLSHPHQPLASFLFVGESGVGKTELAKKLTQVLYPGRESLIKLDMSEFNESFGVSKLLGSPAGYIGYKEQNQFTDRIKMNPHCVIVFDEVDKAHRDVIKLLLQILESGEITDSTGKKISLKHAIIILTTTYGAEEIKKVTLGFGSDAKNSQEKLAQLVSKLKEFFSPEIINRLDRICLFNQLTLDQFIEIALLELDNLNKRLEKYRTQLTVDSETMRSLLTQHPDTLQNARDVKRFIRNEIERLVSEVILNKKIKESYHLIQQHGVFTLK
jgi:ATP-dependent Clp protease ATP-binding subunit ClpA